MRSVRGPVKLTEKWPADRGHATVTAMGKVFAVLLLGAVVAAFLVPFHGLTLYQRVTHRLAPAEIHKKRAGIPVAQVRRERPPKPKEKLSDGDRKALGRLVSETATDSR